MSGDQQKLKGLFAPAYSLLVSIVWHVFPNASLTSSNKLGDMDMLTMMYDGCLGHLQRNESDIMIPFVPFPIPGSGLRHSKTEMPSNVVMVTGYNNTAVVSNTDVMDAFKSFSRQLWSLIILTAAVLTVVVFITFWYKLLLLPKSANGDPAFRLTKRQRSRRCMDQALLIAAANVLKQHTSYSVRGNSFWGKVILFLFATFSLLVIFYFSSMIKTEMVVQKRPDTISSYEDVLAKPNTKPLWTKQLGGHWDFMHAKKNTAEGRIWERANRMGLDSCFLNSAIDIQKSSGPINKREAVWFTPSYIIDVMLTNICAFYRLNGLFMDVNTWYRSDKNAQEKLSVLMQSAALHHDSAKKFNYIIQTEFEHHLQYATLKRLEFSMFPDTGSKSLRDCVANRIIYPDHEIEAVHLQHYERLFVLSGWALLFCLLVLVSEMLRSVNQKFTSNENRETWTRIHGSSS